MTAEKVLEARANVTPGLTRIVQATGVYDLVVLEATLSLTASVVVAPVGFPLAPGHVKVIPTFVASQATPPAEERLRAVTV